MADEEADVLVLNDLPIPENRDLAWKMLRERGDSVQLDSDLALTAQRTVEAVMRHPEIFSSKRAFDILNSPVPLLPLAFDPPEQTRYRRILQPFFSPRSIRPLEAGLRKNAIDLIDPLVERGECDFVADIAEIFPVQAFLAFFGLPADDLPQFMVWKDAILESSDGSGTATESGSAEHAIALFTYLGGLVQSRRGVSGDDVLSQLLCIEGDDALSDAEAIGLCFLFVLAGLDTVTGALGLGMERLAKNSERRKEIVADPGIVPAAVEELVRLDPPAPFTPRVTTRETILDGRTLAAGTHVSTYLAVANRDDAVRPNPFDIDFHRGDNPHASFGLGVHRCLGAHLARLEMKIVYEEWHKRIPAYQITQGTTPRVKWPRGTLGLDSLHLTFGGET
jgi:cytochrome P450